EMPTAMEISESGASYQPVPIDQSDKPLLNEPDLNDMIKVMTFDMMRNDDEWHWVFVFPLEQGEAETTFAEPMPEKEKEDAWTAIFTQAEDSGKMPVKTNMTRKEFQHAVFKEMVDIMSGPLCGLHLGTLKSIDGDEQFLMVSLQSEQAITEIAEISEHRTTIKSAAYDVVKIDMPTDSKLGKKWLKREEGLSLDGLREKGGSAPLFNHYPATVTYRKDKADRLEHFRNPDLIRLSKHRMQHFFNFNSLIKYKAIKQVFAVPWLKIGILFTFWLLFVCLFSF
ncbi:unnamed protein product, partial [Polarella glacialis]